VAKIEWHRGELFPRIGFVITNSRLPAGKVIKVKRCIDWLIKRLVKVGARVSYHARRWYVHVASAFPLAHHYRAVLAWGP
jgi:hypothetical protein